MKAFMSFGKVLLFSCILFMFCALSQQINAQNWRSVNIGGVKYNLNEITWETENLGIVVCDGGKIIYTTDHGETWQVDQIHQSANLNSISWQQSRTGKGPKGIIVGDNGLSFSTSDNGKTWQTRNSGTSNNLNTVFFGWCPSTLQSWAYAVGDNSTILVSQDGGSTWTKQSTLYQYDHFYGLFFQDNEAGWIVGSMGIIYKTYDSGNHWNYVEGDTSNPTYKSVSFASLDKGYICGSNGYIGKTTNYGSTWLKQNSGTTEVLNDIDLDNLGGDDTVAAVGNNGTLLQTTNGGTTWTKYNLDTAANLYDVSTDADGCEWVVGDSGRVFTNRPQVLLPAAPSGLTASPKSSNQIDLSWVDNSNNETGFKIEKKAGENESWASSDTNAVNETEYHDTGLSPNTQYFYRVSSFNSVGESAYSNEVSARTFDTAPLAPNNLKVTAISNSQIDLNWADNSNNESGFKLERKTGQSAFSEIGSFNANVLIFSDKNLGDGLKYIYRVYSYNSAGNSAYSNEANAITLINSPSNLLVTAKSSSQTEIIWTDNSQSENGFKLERRTDQTPFSGLDTVDENAQSYLDNNLVDGTKYTYRIFSYNTNILSNYSNESSAITQLNFPTDLTVKKTNSGQAQLDWKDNSKSESGFTIEKKSGIGNYSKLTDVQTNITTYTDGQVTIGNQYSYRVQSFNNFIKSGYSNEVNIIITDLENETEIPSEYALNQNYPNPFNPVTFIRYDLPKTGFVTLKLYDIHGREVAALVNEVKQPGNYEIRFNSETLHATSLPSGVYFYRLQAENYNETKKMILLK